MREKIAKRALFARVCYIRGCTEEASKLHQEAIALQSKATEKDRLVTGQCEGLQCEFLAERGHWEAAKRAIENAVNTVPKQNRRSYGLVLSTYGRVLFHLALKNRGSYTKAIRTLDDSVKMIRETGRQDELPRVLLVRAKCLTLTGGFDRAREDLDEAYEVADRLKFTLFRADVCLGYARLYLSLPKPDAERAERFLERAGGLIREHGYGQRNSEVADLEEKLKNLGRNDANNEMEDAL